MKKALLVVDVNWHTVRKRIWYYFYLIDYLILKTEVGVIIGTDIWLSNEIHGRDLHEIIYKGIKRTERIRHSLQ